MTARAEVQVGVVGIGFGKHVLVPAIRTDERVNVAAIAASSQDRAGLVAEQLGIPRAYGGWRALLDDPEIDAVCIAVPPVLQAVVAEAAAAEGKHIFCEKPLANDGAGAERVLAAARTTGVTNAVDFEFREVTAWQESRRIIQEGRLGRLQHVALAWHIESATWRAGKKDSWKLRAAEGGGASNLYASHSLDYLEWLFGRVRRLAARFDSEGPVAESQVDAWFDLVDGPPISMSIAINAFLGCGHRLEVYGEEGSLILENGTSDVLSGFTLTMGTRKEGELRQQSIGAPSDGRDGRVDAVGRVFRRFMDALLEGTKASPNLEDALRVQNLLDMMRNANRLGTWQS